MGMSGFVDDEFDMIDLSALNWGFMHHFGCTVCDIDDLIM
jgi:hypothetical protein